MKNKDKVKLLFIIVIIIFLQNITHSVSDPAIAQNKTPIESLNSDFIYIRERIIKSISYINKVQQEKSKKSFQYENVENHKKILIIKKSQEVEINHIKNTSVIYTINIEYTNYKENTIRSLYYQDKQSRRYSYKLWRNKTTISLQNIDYHLLIDKNNNITVKLNIPKKQNIEYYRKHYGAIILSDKLIEEIYMKDNFNLKTTILNYIKKDFEYSEYAKLIEIYNRNSNNINDFIIKTINYYRDMISEEPLKQSSRLNKYAEHRINYHIKNHLLPDNTNELELPLFKEFMDVGEFERKKKLNINENLYEIFVFYKDPINMICSLLHNLNHRAKILSLMSKKIGIAYSKNNNLLCIIIAHQTLNKFPSIFRIFPPHNSKNVSSGIQYTKNSIRGYPVSLHSNGELPDNKDMILHNNAENKELDYTSGSYNGKDTKYVIPNKPYEFDTEYSIIFPFNVLGENKKIKSIEIRFRVMKLVIPYKYDINRYLNLN